jgi:plasmid stability protein
MLRHMRTSMNLPDSLLEAARERAAAEGRSVTSLMEEALRRLLEERRASVSPPSLPTWKGGRLLVDLEDKDVLWEILDADGPK